MEPMLADFAKAIADVSWSAPRIPVVSNLTGRLATEEQLCSPEYWVEHVRQPVRFADGISTLARAGVGALLEVGPGGVLAAMASDCLQAGPGTSPVAVPALRADREEPVALAQALARLHVIGVGVNWSAWFAGSGARWVELPTYAFDRQRFWPSLAELEASGVDAVDAEFWAAVDGGDSASLAASLGVDGSAVAAVLPALSSWRDRRRLESTVDSWRYREVWQPLGGAAPEGLVGTWLVVVPGGCGGDPWVERVVAGLGAGVVCVEVDGGDDRQGLAGRLAGLAGDGWCGVTAGRGWRGVG
jgi:acyl transferase domain-containing protein